VAELCVAFMGHARGHYVLPGGYPSGTYREYARLLGAVAGRWGARPADEFDAALLRQLRDGWVADGLSARTVNTYVVKIRHVWAWALEQAPPLVRPETLLGLRLRGVDERTAPGPKAIAAVPEAHFLAAVGELPPPLADAARLQWLCGCRPGEALACRAGEVRTDGAAEFRGRRVQAPPGCWVFQPSWHKTRRRGKFLAYVLGPRARTLLAPKLEGLPPDAYLFPAPTRASTGARFWGRYRVESYGHALERACLLAGVPHFAPNQIRHAFLTRADAGFGLQDASAAVGHNSPDMTLIYVEKNLERAARVAGALG
jgi:integrase